MTATPLSILLLADDQKGHPNTIHDHIQAFPRYSRHRVTLVNPRNLARSRFLDLGAFDVVVLHYSIVVIWDDYLSPWFREQIAAYDGLKVQFLQDEYRWVDDITTESRRLGIDVLYSVVPPETVNAVYGDRLPNTEILYTLTGYVGEELVDSSVPPLAVRPIDVGYRGRSAPMWLGRLGFEKIEIGRGFLSHAARFELRTDIAWTEHARIYGKQWNDWVASCRTMLASESGSSVVDFDRSIETAVRSYLANNPTATYEEVERDVLSTFPPSPVINTASPRLFEAAAMRTGMIMFPGEYSGIVRPWEHYVPLEKDFGNMAEVVERIRDDAFLADLTERAHADLIASGTYSYRSFVAAFDAVVETRADGRRRGGRVFTPALRLEQLSTGRSYHVSTVYAFARELVLSGLGLKHSLRNPALRRLVLLAHRDLPAADSTSLWADVFRLAILTSVHEGRLVPADGPFYVVTEFDDRAKRITFTSRLDGRGMGAGAARETVRAAVRTGRVEEIVWNHAGVGQYVVFGLPGTRKRVAFDVGRYDAFGVYRFDRLMHVAQRHPDVVLRALEPLLEPEPLQRATATTTNSEVQR